VNQWGFFFSQKRCIACGACTAACWAEHRERRGDAPVDPVQNRTPLPLPADWETTAGEIDSALLAQGTVKESWRRVFTVETGDGPQNAQIFPMSLSCNHCDDPACVKACPVKRICKDDETGAVRVREEIACISCGLCLKQCPWGAPQCYKPYGRKKGEPLAPMTKCDLCGDRIAAGRKPACVAACPMRALDAAPVAKLRERYPSAVQSAVGFSDNPFLGPNLLILPRESRAVQDPDGTN
jgi:anaerobic dimethyl sulfoxide reductase subunit B (iron-sulfur subunit)